MRLLIGILATLAWLIPAAARASEISSLSFFGDSLTDEGRNGRTAPVIWAGVLRNDLSITAGTNYAIGGAVTSSQPSAQFGDSSYLGQVNSFVASGTPVSAGAPAPSTPRGRLAPPARARTCRPGSRRWCRPACTTSCCWASTTSR